MNKQLEAPLLLPVPVEKKKKKPAAVVLVSQWALYNAGVIALTFAFVHIISIYDANLLCDLFHVKLTEAERAKASALRRGFICCNVLQAAGGTLALLLAAHRRRARRALAYVVLAAGDCMSTGVVGIVLTAELGYLFAIITSVTVFVHAMVELHGLLACLLVGGEE